VLVFHDVKLLPKSFVVSHQFAEILFQLLVIVDLVVDLFAEIVLRFVVDENA